MQPQVISPYASDCAATVTTTLATVICPVTNPENNFASCLLQPSHIQTKRITLLHEYVHSACMSANQTQESIDPLVDFPLDMKEVSQDVLSFLIFFSVSNSVIYNKESFVVLGNICSATINSGSPAKV